MVVSCLTSVLGQEIVPSGKAAQVLSPEPLPRAACEDLTG